LLVKSLTAQATKFGHKAGVLSLLNLNHTNSIQCNNYGVTGSLLSFDNFVSDNLTHYLHVLTKVIRIINKIAAIMQLTKTVHTTILYFTLSTQKKTSQLEYRN